MCAFRADQGDIELDSLSGVRASIPGDIRGPQSPATEQVRRWIESPVDFWEECRREFGDVVLLDLGSIGRVVLVSRPDLIRQIFQMTPDEFEVAQYNEHYRHVMGDHSVLVQDGDRHKQQRKLLAPIFQRNQILERLPALEAVIGEAVDGWSEGVAFAPRPTMHAMTFRALVALLFGDLESETSRGLVAAHRVAIATQTGAWGPWRNFGRLKPRIRNVLAGEIDARRSDETLPGSFSRIANGRGPDGEYLANAECEDHVFSLMIAGVDTTAVSLTWALYFLARNVAAQDRLAAELGDATGMALLRLPYLDAVYRETLRQFPVVPTPSGRRLTRDKKLGEFDLVAGTTIVIGSYLAHHRADVFEDPYAFRPERFLDRKFASYEFFPFGGGVRSCVGEMLSEIEFKHALAAIIRRWHVAPSGDAVARPVRHGTLLAPPETLEIRLAARAARTESKPTEILV